MAYLSNYKFNSRKIVITIFDFCLVLFSWGLSFIFRFNFEIPYDHSFLMEHTAPIILFLHGIIYLIFKIYRGSWRYSGIQDIKNIIKVSFLSFILMVIFFLIYRDMYPIPRSVLLLTPLLLVFLMIISRLTYRIFFDYYLHFTDTLIAKKVIIVGSGKEAINLIEFLNKSAEWKIIGVLSNDLTIQDRDISGIKVLGGFNSLPRLHKKYSLHSLFMALPSSSFEERRSVISLTKKLNINVLTIPTFDDLMSGQLSVSRIRHVDIEDLLGRDPVQLDSNGLNKFISGHTLLVTGAGGSIGSELCRQIINFKPKKIVCYDLSEESLYELKISLESIIKCNTLLIYIVGDVKNSIRLSKVLKLHKPQIVFHAAAYKHVPMMENFNASESIQNNAYGTYVAASLSKKFNVSKFVLVSTDKAIRSTNVMGASKRLSEIICQSLQDSSGTDFITVRFGNVLGSSGSVIPLFRSQIAAGGPITLTHSKITRYFMSIPEAAQLVLHAGMIGAMSDIFVLEMGNPVRILDLAKDMIKLSGFDGAEIKIKYIGLRPGEKLYEELLADNETTKPTKYPKIRISNPDKATIKININELLGWMESTSVMEDNDIKSELKMWVIDYTPKIHE
jgi:FlaA1/EpsC-like NDP-sugar epimerase